MLKLYFWRLHFPPEDLLVSSWRLQFPIWRNIALFLKITVLTLKSYITISSHPYSWRLHTLLSKDTVLISVFGNKISDQNVQFYFGKITFSDLKSYRYLPEDYTFRTHFLYFWRLYCQNWSVIVTVYRWIIISLFLKVRIFRSEKL